MGLTTEPVNFERQLTCKQKSKNVHLPRGEGLHALFFLFDVPFFILRNRTQTPSQHHRSCHIHDRGLKYHMRRHWTTGLGEHGEQVLREVVRLRGRRGLLSRSPTRASAIALVWHHKHLDLKKTTVMVGKTCRSTRKPLSWKDTRTLILEKLCGGRFLCFAEVL